MKASVGPVAVAVVLALATMVRPSQVLAQDPTPPEIGATILEDNLRGPTLIRPYKEQASITWAKAYGSS